MDHTCLFILSPPFSGSSILQQMIATSPNVSALRSEGQFVEAVRDVMRDHSDLMAFFGFDCITWRRAYAVRRLATIASLRLRRAARKVREHALTIGVRMKLAQLWRRLARPNAGCPEDRP